LVALKRLKWGVDADADALMRFRREAQALARLAHPGIVQVFDVGEQDGEPYLAMELIEGETLKDRLARGPLRPSSAAALVKGIAEAVGAAHAKGIVHRDLKPSNILLSRQADDSEVLVAKIADFGLAKSTMSDGELTSRGMLAGTP
jgi:serine/threonine-protein kinase